MWKNKDNNNSDDNNINFMTDLSTNRSLKQLDVEFCGLGGLI